VNLFQYFDKIYTLCYGTSNFQTLIDALIQKEYTSKCKNRYSIIKYFVFLQNFVAQYSNGYIPMYFELKNVGMLPIIYFIHYGIIQIKPMRCVRYVSEEL
jgi:hypothetical protein